ncbi:hypothetical protein RGUI_1032 [Rhodovulum sp. P5]|nr:hypothetical protein RGUI_1032 [Rhodovulum sp. P5]
MCRHVGHLSVLGANLWRTGARRKVARFHSTRAGRWEKTLVLTDFRPMGGIPPFIGTVGTP